MIIQSLTLRDFGIFYGTQTLELQPGVYVIQGRNGRGKTTVLNAMRWALYGHYVDRQRRLVSPEVMLNREAKREGKREFGAEVVLSEGSDTYLLRRTQFLSPAGPAPSQLYMERNGVPLTAGDRDRTVDMLLSETVSQFFLFDGEDLSRYESLLSEEDGGSRLIKQSIEQILGLPVLDNTLADLVVVRDEFNKRLARQARQTQQLEQLAGRAEQAQADLESKSADIAELETQEVAQHSTIQDRDDFLQKYESSLDQLKNLEALDEKVKDVEEQRRSLRVLLADQLRDAWRDVLAVAVQPKVEELQRSLEHSQRALAGAVTREQLEQSLAKGHCALCDQPLGLVQERHLAELLATQTRVDTDSVQAKPEDYAQLVLLASVVDTGHAESAMGLDRKIADLDSQEIPLRQESRRLREALENLPENEVTRAQKERDQAQQELGRLRSVIDIAQREKAEIKERLDRAQAEIKRAATGTGQQGDLPRAIDLAQDLSRVFEVAKEQFRGELRDAIEASASEVFVQLTNEPGFKGLQINDSYGLEILDARGEVVTGRSAGQEQVVALALIAALNRNARRRAPVMMDTPFGRLDPDHRAKILDFLAQLFAEQVFLLVHGGEVREEDLAQIAGSINEEFDLRRDDTDRTTIVVRDSA